ncbi:MAG TPA: DUF4129 domain-containing protein [Acidimicrobiales bacterium]|nr:DUF4129 domain-containing protein [Acidimicrobiales bacterium]
MHLPYGFSWQSYLALAVLAALAAWTVYTLLRRGAFGRLRHPRATPGVVVVEGADVLSPLHWRQEADRLAGQGRHREALRCRYRALVGDLATGGLLEEVPGRTTGDYERLVRALFPEVAGRFSAITDLFERCWYGQEAAGPAEDDAFREVAEAVTGTLERRHSRRADGSRGNLDLLAGAGGNPG